jgi:hypothetical protein
MKSRRSSPKFSSNSSNILSNKYLLYASFFFAIVTAANYLLKNNLEAIAVFIIIGLLTTYFSKNMIVVLLTTTILTNFITMFKNRGYSTMMMEGFTSEEIIKLKTIMDDAKAEMDKEKDDTKKAALKVKYESAKKAYDEAVATADANASATNNTPSPSPTPTTTTTPTPTITGSDNTISMGTQPANTVKPPFTNKSNIKDGMSQLSPAAVNTESVNPMMQMKIPGMATGTNAQKEQAYSMLSSVGGGGDALAQQSEMINNLKSIEPILNTAQSFLDKFENSSISKMFSGSGGFPGMSLLTGAAGGNKASPAPIGE